MTTPLDPAQILAEAVRRKEAAKQASQDAAREADDRLEEERTREEAP